MTQKRIPVMETFSYQLPVKERRTAPPANPTAGDRYVVDGAGTGAWTGHNHKVAYCVVGGATPTWAFDNPAAGWQCYDEDEGVFIYFDGAHWHEMDITGDYINANPTSTNGRVPTWSGTTGDQLNDGLDVVTTIRAAGTAVDTALGTEAAIRAAIDAIIGAADAMVFKGVIDCSGNPNYPAADAGHVWKVSDAGKIGGAAGPVVEVGDTLFCIEDGTAAGDHATVGSKWNILQFNIDGAVTSALTSTLDGRLAVWSGTTGRIIKDDLLTATEINNHLTDATVHFTQAQIDHLNILNRGTRTHTHLDNHVNTHTRHRLMQYNATFKAIIYDETDETFA